MKVIAIVMGLVVCAWAGTSRASTIVYSNLDTPLGSYIGGFDYEEVLDDLSLEGVGPHIFESATVAYYGANFNGDEYLTIRLYAMDGAPTPGSFGFNTPGTELFTQSVAIAESGAGLAEFTDGTATVELPDYLGVGLFFGGMKEGESFGPALYDPPTIGSSFEDYWLRGYPNAADAWGLHTFGGNPPVNFGLEIRTAEPTAPVPEPSTWAMLASGLVAVAVFGRRRISRAESDG